MTLDLIYSTALLLALSALYEFNIRLWGERRRAAAVTAGLLFGAICIFGMMHPARLAPGVIFDGRSAILGVAGILPDRWLRRLPVSSRRPTGCGSAVREPGWAWP